MRKRALSIVSKPCLTARSTLSRFMLSGFLFFVMAFTFSLQPSQADQFAPQLDTLFDQLKQANSSQEAAQLESKIWQLWLDGPDQNANSLILQVAAAMSEGRLELALKLCNQLVDSSPKFAEAWNKRATIQYLLGNHALSVADIRETLVLEPRHFGALSGLGLIFLASGKPEAALEAFERVLELNPASANVQGSVKRAQQLLGTDI